MATKWVTPRKAYGTHLDHVKSRALTTDALYVGEPTVHSSFNLGTRVVAAAAASLTTKEFCCGHVIITGAGDAGGVALTLPTAAEITQEMKLSPGDYFDVVIANLTTTGGSTVTITAGANCTVLGTATIALGKVRLLRYFCRGVGETAGLPSGYTGLVFVVE